MATDTIYDSSANNGDAVTGIAAPSGSNPTILVDTSAYEEVTLTVIVHSGTQAGSSIDYQMWHRASGAPSASAMEKRWVGDEDTDLGATGTIALGETGTGSRTFPVVGAQMSFSLSNLQVATNVHVLVVGKRK